MGEPIKRPSSKKKTASSVPAKTQSSVRNRSSSSSGAKKKKTKAQSRKQSTKQNSKKKSVHINKKHMLKTIMVFALIIVAIAVVVHIARQNYNGLGFAKTLKENKYDASAYYYESGLKHYDDSKYTSVVGIDVSEHNGTIDWEKVRSFGIEFAMIRVGYRGNSNGTLVLDSKFVENITNAKAAGLKVGIYFYSEAVSKEEAIEEAKFVLKNIKGYDVTYPVAFDMEEESNTRTSNLTAEERTEITDAFCTIIKRNKYTPMVYGNPTWLHNNLNMEYMTNYQTWIAHYAGSFDGVGPSYKYEYTMWQYSSTAKLNGINTRVDMNIMLVKK